MGQHVRLLHSIHKSKFADALSTGLKAASEFPALGLEMRRGVVYCWLDKADDRLSSGGQRADFVYLEVEVNQDRCLVADMELISLAMMYHQGSGGKPRNPGAARLLAEAYRVTAVPLAEYAPGMFCTPEVLVKGDIAAECIRMAADERP